jgi:hypothetical protein
MRTWLSKVPTRKGGVGHPTTIEKGNRTAKERGQECLYHKKRPQGEPIRKNRSGQAEGARPALQMQISEAGFGGG